MNFLSTEGQRKVDTHTDPRIDGPTKHLYINDRNSLSQKFNLFREQILHADHATITATSNNYYS